MTTPTFIAIVDLSTSAADRPTALAQLEGERPAVRALPGCVDFRVFPGRPGDTDVTVVHEWVDQASFDRYLASDAFARSGEVLRPLLTEPPSSRRFRAELVETVA